MNLSVAQNKFALIILSFLIVAAAIFIAFISLAEAQEQVQLSTSYLWVEIYSSFIKGEGFTPNASVSLEVYDASVNGDLIFGPQEIPTDANGVFENENSFYYQPGNLIRVSDPTAVITRELELADLSFLWLDPTTDVITGTAPAGEQVTITIHEVSGGDSMTVPADPESIWVADFSARFDLVYTHWVSVRLVDLDGDQTVLYSRAGARINAGILTSDLTLEAFTPNALVQLEVYDSEEGGELVFGPTEVPTGPDGKFNGNGLIGLLPGDFIRATDLTHNATKEIVLNLDITEVNTATDVVSGTSFAFAQVRVAVYGDESDSQIEVDADVNGNWRADFSGLFDIIPDTDVEATANDADGDQVLYMGFGDPYFQAFSYSNYVGFYDFYPEEMFSFEVVDDIGATVFWTDTLLADRQGWYWIGSEDGIPINPGYTLTAVDTIRDISVSLVVDELMIQHVDYIEDIVAGYGPPQTEIRLQVGAPHFDITSTITGTWNVNLMDDFGFDLPAGQWVFASVIHWDEGTSTTYVWYDDDIDGIDDRLDNALEAYNPDQSDIDGDGVGDVSDPCPSDPQDQCDPTGSVSESIGEDGGIVQTDNGNTMIEIPSNSINEETSISITDIGSGYALTTDVGELDAVFGVELGPPGLTFTLPVTITFHWNDADQDGFVDGTGINEEDLVIIKDGVKLTDYCLSDPGCDQVNDVFTFQVSSFSLFAIAGEKTRFDLYLPWVSR